MQAEFTEKYLRKNIILNIGKQGQYEKIRNTATENLGVKDVAYNFNRYNCMPL